ncbi:MAG TPA: GNAT family N-acetyltransferase [Allosphingosinicella sp.]|nr:GNAT family N-acetyltransferase [Allosphingosinicella sp.]
MGQGSGRPAEIVPLGQAREAEWRILWQAYLDFYEAAVTPEVTDRLWAALVPGDETWRGFGATVDGALVGFAIVIGHPATWSLAPTAYLEDLFVRPDARGQGIGRSLIEAIAAEGRERGWASLYWHTKAGNHAARALYDRFTPADDFVRYRLTLGG